MAEVNFNIQSGASSFTTAKYRSETNWIRSCKLYWKQDANDPLLFHWWMTVLKGSNATGSICSLRSINLTAAVSNTRIKSSSSALTRSDRIGDSNLTQYSENLSAYSNEVSDVTSDSESATLYYVTPDSNTQSSGPCLWDKSESDVLIAGNFTIQHPGQNTATITLNLAVRFNDVGSYSEVTGSQQYAVELPTCTATFNANGGTTVNPETITQNYGVELGTLPEAERTGYTLDGWYTAATDGTKISTTTTITKDVTYYAHWSKITYTNTVSHWLTGFQYGEGNNSSGNCFNPGNTTFTAPFDSNFVMDASKSTKIPKGFYLSYFNTSSISGSYDQYSIDTTVTQKAYAMNFEYYYNPSPYNIEYNLNGGTLSSVNPSSYNVLYGVSLNDPDRKGYVFNGWDMASQAGSVNLPAKDENWNYTTIINGVEPGKTYKITMSSAVASGTASQFTTLVYDFTDSKDLYTSVNSFGSNISYFVTCPVSADSSHDIQIIVYAGVAGSTSGISATYSNVQIEYAYAITGINEGCNATFKNAGDLYAQLKTRTTGDVSLTAQWTPISYTVEYRGNGATKGSTATSTHTYNSAKSLTANGFTRTGYKFLGWSTSATGPVNYTDEASVENLQETDGSTVILYAIWEALATMFVKVDGAYRAGIPYVKVDDEWKRATAVYIKVNDQWKLSTR